MFFFPGGWPMGFEVLVIQMSFQKGLAVIAVRTGFIGVD
jgi:hypothetical protein